LALLAGYLDSPAVETLSGPFVPVEAGSLVAAGLSSELANQVEQGETEMEAAGLRGQSGAWISESPIDSKTLAALESIGVNRLVVPAGTTSGTLTRLTLSRPFLFETQTGTAPTASTEPSGSIGSSSPSSTQVLAAQADAQLTSDFEAGDLGSRTLGSGSSALDAHTLLADLALIYFEEPNLNTPRGVVAVPPSSWLPSPAFVDTFLTGLATNPTLDPVSFDNLLSQVPHTSQGYPLVRSPLSGAPSGSSLPARQIRAARLSFEALSSAVHDPATVRGLDNLLLVAESSTLRSSQQVAAVAGYRSSLNRILGELRLTTDHVTLTASTAKMPITLLSDASFPITAVVRLTSDKLAFPHGDSTSVTLDRKTATVYITVRARTPGDFPVRVSVVSPSGHLLLASGFLSVGSTTPSGVAIGLSIAAALVLLAWWARTSLGLAKRGAHARRTGGVHAQPSR
jgi:hypothetical protein